jgi:hypothetical protein
MIMISGTFLVFERVFLYIKAHIKYFSLILVWFLEELVDCNLWMWIEATKLSHSYKFYSCAFFAI